MRLLDIYIPEVSTYVRYKVLDPIDVDMFVEQHKFEAKDEYTQSILENLVFNLRSDVAERLKTMDKQSAKAALQSICNGCVMLNPGLNMDTWTVLRMAGSASETMPNAGPKQKKARPRGQARRITKAHFLGLEPYLKSKVVGQDQAIDEIVNALKRSQAGLADENRPLGVFLLAGASGVGKTHLARELHKYLFGTESDIVRIDCGEYQQQHENQKLIGSPPGYIGHDEGGTLTNALAKNPSTVVLLDEAEKAHADLWNTFLRVFDEGMLTDGSGKTASFKDAIIMITTNLGNAATVRHQLDRGMGFNSKDFIYNKDAKVPTRQLVEKNAYDAIRNGFKPELLNRIDKTIVFNYLTDEDLAKIADLELAAIDEKLASRGLSITYDDATVKAMILQGVNAIEGARGLSRIRREKIENILSDTILSAARWPRGTVFEISYDEELGFHINAKKPQKVEVSNS